MPHVERTKTPTSFGFQFFLFVHRISGSHYVLKRPDNPRVRVTLPYHTRDLKRGTLASIIEQAGLTTEAFMDLL
jgi:predicted RNA binding protein YcfA (HicA-like mRNA interferase family)